MSDLPTRERLTDALRQAGALGGGRVVEAVVLSTRATILSEIVRLRLSYAGAAEGGPATVLVKRENPGRAGQGWQAGITEAAFYATVAPALPAGLVPRCFDAVVDEAARTWQLCLEDLTETHEMPSPWPLPPSLDVCGEIAVARARFHAAWWDDARLGTTVGQRPDEAAIAARGGRVAAACEAWFDLVGDGLPRARRVLLERLVAASPRLHAEDLVRPGLTLAHGDAHVWNCLVPREGGGDVRLFDWDCWHLGRGAEDLAYMMAMHWYPDRRARSERALLDRYHATLLDMGVGRFDRAALDEEYRRAVVSLLTFPARQAAYGIPPVIWWNNFERIALAFDDLGCEELIG